MSAEEFDPFAGGELLRVSPTTGPQQEIMASAQMSEEANTAFNEAVSITYQGTLDRELLSRCIDTLIQRHDILRATFSRNGHEICLQEASTGTMQFEDCRHLDEAAQKQKIRDLWRQIAISPMNLEEGPLFSTWLLQLGDETHELVIAYHHMICDGWATGLLLNELATLYRQQGSADNLPAPQSFFDFSEQNEASQVANKDVDYWVEQFAELPPTLDIPLDKARPNERSFRATRYDVVWQGELVKTLPKVAAGMKASLVNLVMAGYFALLHRMTQNEDIVVGLPVAGQAAFNRTNQVGHMVQLLPIRLRFDGSTRFDELVAQVKSAVLDASDHPNFTFGKLFTELKDIKIDRSRVPLVSTIFNIDQPMPPMDYGTATATVRTVPRAAENFEVFLNILPTPDSLIIEATYLTDLFSEATLSAWLDALQLMLSQVADNPEITVDALALSDGVPQLVTTVNQTDKTLEAKDFITSFMRQVDQNPEAVALICGEQQFTYRDLDRQSSALAARLKELDVTAQSIVGICCQRSEKLVLSALAVLKLGAAYLPLDPDFPEERLLYMIADAGAMAIIEDDTTPQSIRDADTVHLNYIELDHIEPDHIELDKDQLGSDSEVSDLQIDTSLFNASDLAYLIYTSGSTGKPKGVEVPRGAMLNFLDSMSKTPGCSAEDRLLAVTTMAFDISVLELFLPLYVGGTVVIADNNEVKEGDKLAALIQQHKVTIMQATPATWRVLLHSPWGEPSNNINQLRALCGGEPLPPDLVADLLPAVGELWNMFGPTETTVWSSCKRITNADDMITVGKPIANTQIYILDKQLQPLPLSVPGELCIGGLGVALGYHERPELTAERFVEHPELGRLYRTGDWAKWLPSGELQHLGRLDDQVKLRGYRIELGEIEAALANSEQVDRAAVYLWELSPEDIRIVACCVPSSAAGIQSVALRRQLRSRLPNYMVPQYFLTVDEIPLTPNGKVNRRALPKPETNESTLLSQSTLQSDSEKLIAKIWTDLIKPRRAIGRDDNFFEMGGHSLLALEAIRQIEQATEQRLTPREIVTERLSSLAEKIASTPDEQSISDPGPSHLPTHAVRHPSAEQMRIITRQLQQPETTCNNLPAAWVLEGELNVAAFRRAVSRLFERQTALRTIVTKADEQYQLVLKHIDDIDIPIIEDVTTAEDPLAKALEAATALSIKPFDIIDQLLCRVVLYKLSAQQHLFFIVPHQLVFDGWSFDILLRELAVYYAACCENQASTLAPLSLEYRDYAEWCVNRTPDGEALAFHQQSLNTSATLPHIDSSATKQSCTRREFFHSADQLNKLETFCSQGDARLHEVLFTIFTKSLSELTGKHEFVLGLPVTGRYNPDVINLIGSFVSVLPCTIELKGDQFAAQVHDISQQLKTFHIHQDLSFAEILKDTPWQDQNFPAITPAVFGFQDIRNRPQQWLDLNLKQIDMPRAQTEVPIEFWTRVQPNGLVAVFDYDSGQVEESVIESVAASFERILGDLDNVSHSFTPVTEPTAPPAADKTEETPAKKPFWKRFMR